LVFSQLVSTEPLAASIDIGNREKGSRKGGAMAKGRDKPKKEAKKPKKDKGAKKGKGK
jgi:hypothetical protein